jgi:hypothetical protein
VAFSPRPLFLRRYGQLHFLDNKKPKRSELKGKKKEERMKNWKMIIAVLGMVSLGIGLIPAGAIDAQKLPPNAIIDKSKLPKPGCVPKTCEQAGAESGDISDGCGHVVHCGIAQKVSVTVDPPQYTGICPKTLKFTGTITAKKKGKVGYGWSGYNALGYHNPLYNGTLSFEAAGSKQVFWDYTVPLNLPADKQHVEFWADGADAVTANFKVTCTKVLKPGDGVPLDPKQ